MQRQATSALQIQLSSCLTGRIFGVVRNFGRHVFQAIPAPPESYLLQKRELNQIASPSIDAISCQVACVTCDPFDRMLIAQALQHDLTMLTVDDVVKTYPVKIFST